MIRQEFILPKQIDGISGRAFLDTYTISTDLQTEISSNQILYTEAALLWSALFTGGKWEHSEWIHAGFVSNEPFSKLQLLTTGDKLSSTLAVIYTIRLVKQSEESGFLMMETILHAVRGKLVESQHKIEDLLSDLTVRSLQSTTLTLREKLLVAKEIEEKDTLDSIAKWSKFFKLSAKKKRQYRAQKTILKSGTTYGDKLERMKPIELIRSDSPEAALDFVHRLSEGKVAMYDFKKRDKKLKGALIVCYDESGSMRDLDEQGKGFLVALLALAKQQKRDFVFIPFSGTVDSKEIQVFSKGKYKIAEFLAMLLSYSGGGTNFKAPLNYVLHYMKQSKIGGDVLFITDGISHLDESFKKDFIFEKEQNKFHMMSILIGHNKHMGDLPEISNEVLKLVDFKDQQHLKIFEL